MQGAEPALLEADLPTLIRACANGDEAAWNAFVDRFHRRIVILVARALKTGPCQSSETHGELVQDVYVRLLAHDRRALDAWRGSSECSFASYLATIVHAVVCDSLKKQKSRKRAASLVALDADDGPAVRDLVAAPATASPEHALSEQSASDRVRDLLARVERGPLAYRNSLVFMLHVVDGLTASEIACLPGLDMTISNVETVLRRTKQRLRETIGAPVNL
jgi:RNA polymerase sigma factor (sigma-70 family)